MKKIRSREELAELRAKYRDDVVMRLVSDEPEKRTEVLVGMAECGNRAGARGILKEMFDAVNDARLENVSVIAVDCMGKCAIEPTVEIKIPGKQTVRYGKVTTQLARNIVKQHLCEGKAVDGAVMEVL